MNLLICMLAGLVATGVTFGSNWVALIPWRKAGGAHWSEQARLLFPVFSSARSSLWTVPSSLTLAVELWWPDTSPLWVFVAVAPFLARVRGICL